MTTTREQLAQLAEYYAEAVENPEAFKNWEWQHSGGWRTCEVHLGLYGNVIAFRRKPATIEITYRNTTYTLPRRESMDRCADSLRMVFGDPDQAMQWFDAMREIRGGKA